MRFLQALTMVMLFATAMAQLVIPVDGKFPVPQQLEFRGIWTPTEMKSISENAFVCFASTGANTPETMFPNSGPCESLQYRLMTLRKDSDGRTQPPTDFKRGAIDSRQINPRIGQEPLSERTFPFKMLVFECFLFGGIWVCCPMTVSVVSHRTPGRRSARMTYLNQQPE
jgi:hypothetical protein